MRERRYGNSRTRSPLQPPLPQGRAYSPLASRRHREASPPRHHVREASSPRHHYREASLPRHHYREVSQLRTRDIDEEPSRLHSRYLSAPSRVGHELSPPTGRHRGYTPSPPLPPPLPQKFEHSPPHYHFEAREPLHSQPFTDAHINSSTLGLITDRWKEKSIGRESYESRCYEADRYIDRYGESSLQKKSGLNERSSYGDSASTKFQWKQLLDEKQAAVEGELSKRTSMSDRVYQGKGGDVSGIGLGLNPASMKDNGHVRNGIFPGYLVPSTVASDKYGYGNSDTGLGLVGDGTWKYDKLFAGEPSREEEKLKFEYVDVPNAVSSGQSHAPIYPYVSKDRLPGYLEETGHDGYDQRPPVWSSYKESLDSSLAINRSMEKVGCEYVYTEGRRNEDSDFRSLPDKLYNENFESVREKYGLQGAFKSSPMELLADRIEGYDDSGGECSGRSRLLDDQHYVSGASYMEGQDEEYGVGTTHIMHNREEYLDYEPSNIVEGDGFGEGDGSWHYGDNCGSFSLSGHEEGLADAEWSSQHRLTEEELGSLGPSEKTVKRKCGFDKRRLGYNFEGELPQNVDSSDLYYEDQCQINGNANCLYGRLRNGRFEGTYDSHSNKRRAIPKDYLFSDDTSKTMKRNWRKHVAQPVRDIKKRLGPPPGNRKAYPWVKAHVSQAKLNDGISHSSQGGDTLETVADDFDNANRNMGTAKAEPPEETEEFTQLVNGAFLKFVKLLNENAAQRRKYADQGQSGILKCGICGRNSKEFIDTLSLAMHAFSTRATGFRAEHLGLHKALCILMGWNSALGPNGTWVRQVLPDAEASALRDDLIIWPPIVIIHNSSIANAAPVDRVILGVEEIQAILKEMGLGGDKTKVMRGKPANQSIMVASFHGTFSGLWEAESLHKHFIEKRQGRVEFDQISGRRKRIHGTGKAPEDKVSVLYGYLGIAEDLDKLEFEMKKRCVVRSRREIQEIVDVQLKCS
ncbi:uncharacterized protein LOC116200259 [Punica granatum]|uniref:XS domain-containing protein n=2 Tax=Punica granatum TaxID=22663 RepID=A0A218WNW1_PUNGR|nr:uncharacterized protein LOC116200259 [Punica granatum]OWM73682.1 hypothetical protein CDL15_Pgr026782 [Punica granatum]PKI53654.1 hypothetical protein CRG98_025895 [Punica granatum]